MATYELCRKYNAKNDNEKYYLKRIKPKIDFSDIIIRVSIYGFKFAFKPTREYMLRGFFLVSVSEGKAEVLDEGDNLHNKNMHSRYVIFLKNGEPTIMERSHFLLNEDISLLGGKCI